MENQRLKGHILIICAGLCDSTVGWFREVEKQSAERDSQYDYSAED